MMRRRRRRRRNMLLMFSRRRLRTRARPHSILRDASQKFFIGRVPDEGSAWFFKRRGADDRE